VRQTNAVPLRDDAGAACGLMRPSRALSQWTSDPWHERDLIASRRHALASFAVGWFDTDLVVGIEWEWLFRQHRLATRAPVANLRRATSPSSCLGNPAWSLLTQRCGVRWLLGRRHSAKVQRLQRAPDVLPPKLTHATLT
jgi:hypothetical protein